MRSSNQLELPLLLKLKWNNGKPILYFNFYFAGIEQIEHLININIHSSHNWLIVHGWQYRYTQNRPKAVWLKAISPKITWPKALFCRMSVWPQKPFSRLAKCWPNVRLTEWSNLVEWSIWPKCSFDRMNVWPNVFSGRTNFLAELSFGRMAGSNCFTKICFKNIVKLKV